MYTTEFREFINCHRNDDVCKLRLKYSDSQIDWIEFAIIQIEAWQKNRNKLSLWNNNEFLLYPSALSVEQASSEYTARYKQNIVRDKYQTLCDLTGGLGVDTYFFSQVIPEVTYIERSPLYCKTAKYNFDILQCDNIVVNEADCRDYLSDDHPMHDIYYIDPARRGNGNCRVYNLSDCEPDISELIPIIKSENSDFLIKASPMLDVSHTINKYPAISHIYILSVKNECKELLLMMSSKMQSPTPFIECVNIISDTEIQKSSYRLTDEKNVIACYTQEMGKYLYEPNSSIMKAGVYNLISHEYNICKLAQNTHLYTSNEYVNNFPGRIFSIMGIIPFSKSNLKKCSKLYPKANISCRNFPLSVEDIRHRSKISDGGDTYIFATTVGEKEKVLIVCCKVFSI